MYHSGHDHAVDAINAALDALEARPRLGETHTSPIPADPSVHTCSAMAQFRARAVVSSSGDSVPSQCFEVPVGAHPTEDEVTELLQSFKKSLLEPPKCSAAYLTGSTTL